MQLDERLLVGEDRHREIDRPRLEVDQALARVGIDLEHDAVEVRAVAPVAVEAVDDDLLALVPGLERERPGADGVLGERVAPRADPGRRHHREHREVAEQRRVRTADVDLDGVGVDRDDLLDVLEQRAPVAAARAEVVRVAGVEQALEREHDRVGVERRAVVEDDLVAELERPGLAVGRDLPAGRQARLDVGRPRLPADEALEHELADLDRLAVGDAHRVERDGVGGLGDDERTGIAPVVHLDVRRVAAQRRERKREPADPHCAGL